MLITTTTTTFITGEMNNEKILTDGNTIRIRAMKVATTMKWTGGQDIGIGGTTTGSIETIITIMDTKKTKTMEK